MFVFCLNYQRKTGASIIEFVELESFIEKCYEDSESTESDITDLEFSNFSFESI